MKIKHVYALYFSPTGTTQKTVNAIAQGTGIPVEEIDLTLPKTRRLFNHLFSEDELVVVGLPVYAGRIPMDLEDFFSGLRGNNTPAVAVVVFGNREYNDALIELKMQLEQRGFIVRAGAAFIGEHTFSNKIATGRPDANDLAVAYDFGGKAAKYIAADVFSNLSLKGNYPFMWKGYNPRVHIDFPPHPRLITTDICTQCGLCAKNCPWEAINPKDCKERDYAKCMICYRCLKQCPTSAIEFTGEKFLEFLPQFEARLNVKRCEPELFLPSS